MAHIFPRHRLRGYELPDRRLLTEAFADLTAKLQGNRLNEHDFSSIDPATAAKLLNGATFESGCYYKAHLLWYDVDLELTTGAHSYAKPNRTGPRGSAATVAEGAAWQPVVDFNTGDRTHKSIACEAGDVLYIVAFAQSAGWSGDLGVTPDVVSLDPYRLQYTLSVGGVIQTDTITGPAQVPDPPPRQTYKRVRAVSSAADFDYRHVEWVHNGTGLPNHLQPVRLTKVLTVPEGTHDVELLVRRVPRVEYDVDNAGVGSSMQIGNRRLFVLQMRGGGKVAAGTTAPTLAVPEWEEGETISVASVNTARLHALRDAINGIPEGAVARGAFHADHLPTHVRTPQVQMLTPAADVPIPATSTYAGHGAAGGWQQVGDGAGGFLRVTGATTISGQDGVLVVLANVEVADLGVALSIENRVVLAASLRYMDATGAWNVLGDTEALLTPRNPTRVDGASGAMFGTAGMDPALEDVPLFWAMSTTQLLLDNPNATTIQRIEAVISTWDATGTALVVDASTAAATLTAFVLRGVPVA